MSFQKRSNSEVRVLIQDLVASSGQLLPAFQISSVWAILNESENDKEDKNQGFSSLGILAKW